MIVISASRRTDIPAFFMPWMMRRVREGFVMVRNPRNPLHVMRVSLRTEDVAAVVWWSRDYGRLIEHLDELDDAGLRGMFQFTLTGYGPPIEPGGPATDKALAQFETLASRYGPQRVVWRYDPIVLGSGHTHAWHIDQFSRLASQLQGCVRDVAISFLDWYPSARTGLRELTSETGESWPVPSLQQRAALARELVAVGVDHGMRVRACCELDVVQAGAIEGARCIDPEVIRDIAGPTLELKPSPTRKGCGCVQARDIGAYHTCPRGCAYCYANSSVAAGEAGARQVDITSNHLGAGDLQESSPRRARPGQLLLNLSDATTESRRH